MGQEQYSVSKLFYAVFNAFIIYITYNIYIFLSFKIDFARNPDFTSLTKRVYTANISNPLMLGQIPILTNCQSVYGGQREKHHLKKRQRMLKLNLHSSLRFSGMALLVLEGTPVWKLCVGGQFKNPCIGIEGRQEPHSSLVCFLLVLYPGWQRVGTLGSEGR